MVGGLRSRCVISTWLVLTNSGIVMSSLSPEILLIGSFAIGVVVEVHFLGEAFIGNDLLCDKEMEFCG